MKSKDPSAVETVFFSTEIFLNSLNIYIYFILQNNRKREE